MFPGASLPHCFSLFCAFGPVVRVRVSVQEAPGIRQSWVQTSAHPVSSYATGGVSDLTKWAEVASRPAAMGPVTLREVPSMSGAPSRAPSARLPLT